MAGITKSHLTMNRWIRRFIVVAVSIVGSVLTFWRLLQISPPTWETSEYPAIALWSLPLGLLVLMVAKLPRRWLAGSSIVIRG
jgi:hypothetical protein